MPAGQQMDELTLKSIISREINESQGAEGGQLSNDRLEALQLYQGDPFGNEIDGRSQVVMRSVLEAVEWVLPALLRIFTASDKIGEFEAQGTDNPQLLAMREAGAEQATQYIGHIFYKDNPGFLILHDWFKDALLQRLGWVKVYWDNATVIQTNTYERLPEAEYQALLSQPGTEAVDERSYTAPIGEVGPMGPGLEGAAPPMLYDCTLRTVRSEGRVKIETVPPEEVLISRRAKSTGPVPFLCHRVERTYSDLVSQGYDREVLDSIPSIDTLGMNQEVVERYEEEDQAPGDLRTDDSMRTIWVEESYIRLDYDGDGVAELRKVVTALGGSRVLTRGGEPDVELIDEVPLLSICPIPMPHKKVGMSIADLVGDLQLIKSTLMRQMLDNVYLSNNPRTEVADTVVNENTYDDLLVSRPGGLIRTKAPGGLQQFVTPFVAEKTFQILEYIDQTQEVRTGVDRRNQGLAPDDLNKTAAAAAMYQQAAAQRVELIARIFAETGVKEVCRRILGLVTRYQQHERIVRLTGKYVPMDPRRWDDNMDITVSVGLGTGSRDLVAAHMKEIVQAQFEIVKLQQGIDGPLVRAQNVFDALDYATEQMGLKQSFFSDPSHPPQPEPGAPPPQPKPNPEMIKVQAQIAADQARQEASVQADQRKEQFDMQRDQQRAEIERQNDERDFAMRQQQAQQDAKLKHWEAEQRAALAVREMEMRMALQEREMQMKAAAGAYAPRQPQAGAPA